jgi:hypothetical protein
MATSEGESVMKDNTMDWLLQLCDHHSIRFRCNYYAFLTIQEALRAKGKCLRCKLDIPSDIQPVNVEKVNY